MPNITKNIEDILKKIEKHNKNMTLEIIDNEIYVYPRYISSRTKYGIDTNVFKLKLPKQHTENYIWAEPSELYETILSDISMTIRTFTFSSLDELVHDFLLKFETEPDRKILTKYISSWSVHDINNLNKLNDWIQTELDNISKTEE